MTFLRASVLVLLLLANAGCRDSLPGSPVLHALTPDRGPEGSEVAVVITGENLAPSLFADFSAPSASRLEGPYRARLGRAWLRDVRLKSDGTLTATVPDDLTPGSYALTVVRDDGTEWVLADAYRSLPVSRLAELVTALRFEPIPAAEAFTPFTVRLSAVDAAGAVVPAYNEQVTLSDETGSVVPMTVAFSLGHWTGQVEVRAQHAANLLRAEDAAGHRGESNAFVVAARQGFALRFASAPRLVAAGDCSGGIELELRDDLGQAVAARTVTPVQLTAAPAAGVTFFADTGCSTLLTAAALAAGARSLTLAFRATKAGPLQLSATSPSLGPAQQTQTVLSAPAQRLSFLTGPQILNAGACSARAVVVPQDLYGNTVTGLGGAATFAVAPTGGLSLFQDPQCGVPALALPFDAPTGEVRLYFRGETAAMFTVTVSASGLSPTQQAVQVLPEGFATRLAFVTAPQTLAAGACSALVGLQSQDSFGNAVAGPGALQVPLAALPAGLEVHEDSACADAPVAAVALAAGNSTRTFFVRAPRSGTYALTASASGLTPALQDVVITAASPSRLAFTSPPRTARAGACSEVLALEVRDGFDNPSAPGAVTLSLSAQGAPVAFFADDLCTVSLASLALPDGATTARLHVKGTLAGAADVTVAGAALSPATQAATLTPTDPQRLAFLGAPQTVPAGACSGVVTLQSQDVYGNASPVGAATALAFSANPTAGFGFFTDAGCTASATALSLPAGASSATLFFRGVTAGPVQLTASSAGLSPATQQHALTVAPASAIAFTSQPVPVAAGGCSAEVRVHTQDAYGNASVPASAVSATPSASPAPGVTFFADPGCNTPLVSLPLTSGVGAFHFRATVAGAFTLTVQATDFLSASQGQGVTAAAPQRLTFASAPQTVTAGACSALTRVQLEDTYGNPAPSAAAAPVALAAAPAASFAFYADPACGTALTSRPLAAGASEVAFYFKGLLASAVTLTASTAGVLDATQTATVSAASTPAKLAFLTPSRSASAGACSLVLTVQAQDSFGNATPVAASTPVSLSAAPSAGLTFYSDAGCTTAASTVAIAAAASTVGVYFLGTAAGGFTATASAAGLTGAAQAHSVTPGAPAKLAFTSAAQSLAAGACSGRVELTLQDASGNATPAPGALAVALSAPGGFTYYSDASCGTAATGTAFAASATTASVWFKATQVGSHALAASAAGVTGASQTQVLTAAAPSRLAFTTAAQGLLAGACSLAATVETRDAFGNAAPVSALTTVALAAVPPTGVTFYSDAACTQGVSSRSLAAGASAVGFFWRGTLAGAFNLSASASGLTGAQQTQAVAAAPPSTLAFTTPSRQTVAGACSPVLRVEARDAYGNLSPVSADTPLSLSATPPAGFTFSPVAGCGSPSATLLLATGQSAVDFYFTGTVAGAATLSVSGLSSASQGATVTPGSPASLAWGAIASSQPQGVPVAVTVSAVDAFGNVAPSFTGAASLALAPAGTVACVTSCGSATSTTAFVAGAWTGSVTLATAVGTGRTLQATSGALSGDSSPFDVTAATASPPVARFTASPVVLLAGQSVTFDASTSSDLETAASELTVSWDFTGAAATAPPWTAWTTTKTAVYTYSTAGTFTPRLAVRDGAGNVAYTSRVLIVLPGASASLRCVVTTSSVTVDDGATSCAGPYGTDGKLSLAEAVRLSNSTSGRQVITFDGPRTLVADVELVLSADVDVVAPAGVILSSVQLRFSGGSSTLAGVEMTGNARSLTLQSGATVAVSDVYLHDFKDVQVKGVASFTRARLTRCGADCMDVDGSSARLTLRHSEISGTPSHDGLVVGACGLSQTVDVASTLFTGLKTAISINCTSSEVVNNTFHANQTGVDYSNNGLTHILRNNLFTQNSSNAATRCGLLGLFVTRDYHLLYQNGSSGCLAGDGNTLNADPRYVFSAGGDYRIQTTSPARDSAVDVGLDLNDAAPGRYFGAGPDRGARETY